MQKDQLISCLLLKPEDCNALAKKSPYGSPKHQGNEQEFFTLHSKHNIYQSFHRILRVSYCHAISEVINQNARNQKVKISLPEITS